MVLLIVAVVIGALTPSVLRQIEHARINRAANVIAADFLQIQTMAGRQQAPLRMVVDVTLKTISINLTSGTTLSVRRLGTDTEFKIGTLAASPTSVLVLPSGMASTQITITVTTSGYSKQIRMSRAGQVRIL